MSICDPMPTLQVSTQLVCGSVSFSYNSQGKDVIAGSRRSDLYNNGRQWLEIQSAVFDSLIEVAVEMQGKRCRVAIHGSPPLDPAEAIEYLVHYLSSLGPYLPPSKQTELASAITKQTSKFPGNYRSFFFFFLLTCQ